MALGDITSTHSRRDACASTRHSSVETLTVFSFTAGQAAAGERLINSMEQGFYRRISLTTNNEDAAVAVTIRLYVSNNPVVQTTVADVIAHSDLLATDIVAVTSVTDHVHALSIAGGVDYHKLIADYTYLYITAQVAGITTADSMSIHGTLES